jgi:Tol biopolymer transport system component
MSPRLQTLLMSLGSLSLAGLFLVGLGVGLALTPSSFKLTRLTTSPSFDRTSFNPSLSADGTKVVFDSNADLLNQGVSFDQHELWLYDMTTMTLTRITTSAVNRRSCCASLNANGTKIAFLSDADLLNQGIPQGQKEIWLYDTTTLTFTRLTTSLMANQDNGSPKLNADGTKVFFYSNADLLNPGIPLGQYEIWLYDTTTMAFTRLTTGNGGWSVFPSPSADGTKIVFHSNADFLNQGIPHNQSEIWLYDMNTLTVTRLTTSSVANRYSTNSSISPDGSKVAFSSDADFLNQGIPAGHREVWLYDAEAMTLTRLTTTTSNAGAVSFSFNTQGSKLVFDASADFFNQGIPLEQSEIWLYDTTAMTLTRLTTATADFQDSFAPSMSADGTKIAFSSTTNFYDPLALYNALEIWMYESAIRYYLPLMIKG